MSDSPLSHLTSATVPTGLRPLVSAEIAAKLLAVSPRTLWTLTHSREIPMVKIGRSVRYDPRDLDAYIQSRRTCTGQIRQ